MRIKLSNSDWYTIVAHERGYRVDVDGRVMSLMGRYLKCKKHKSNHGNVYYYEFTVYDPTTHKRGHVMVHKLQAYQKFDLLAFKDSIRHLNGNSLDNSEENIDIGTQHDNYMDRDPNVRLEHARVAASYLRSLTEEQVDELVKLHLSGWTYKMLTKKYGIVKSTVSYIINGKTYNH